MSRRNLKALKRSKCSYKTCTRDFKKSNGYYYKGKYYCSKGHARKANKKDGS